LKADDVIPSHVPLYIRPDCMKHARPLVESWDPYTASDVSVRPDCMKHARPLVESWDPYTASDVSAQILRDFYTVSRHFVSRS